MHPTDQQHMFQKIDAQAEAASHFYRPGWDDAKTFIAEKRRTESLYSSWEPANITDAVDQADAIQAQELSNRFHTEYIFETYGWTVEQYDAWVQKVNKEERDFWTKPDFNSNKEG